MVDKVLEIQLNTVICACSDLWQIAELCCWFWTVFVHVPLVGCQCKVWFPSSSWCTTSLKAKNSSLLHSDCLLQNFIQYQCLHFYGLRKKLSLCFSISVFCRNLHPYSCFFHSSQAQRFLSWWEVKCIIFSVCKKVSNVRSQESFLRFWQQPVKSNCPAFIYVLS